MKGIAVSLKLVLFTIAFTGAGLLLYCFCTGFHPNLPLHFSGVSSTGVAGRVIVIDAGHGGEDGGAVGADGTLEKDLNLAVAENVAQMLKYGGFDVILTRDDDVMLTDGQPGKKKQADLRERLNIAHKSEDNVLISIHMNKFPDSRVHGLQVYYSKNKPLSETLAKAVQQTAADTFQPDNKRPVKEATSAIYILHHAKVPAILIECGFLSNATDLENLKKEDYQKQLSAVISASIMSSILAEE